MKLCFDETRYEVLTITEEGKTLVCRAFEDIPYVEHPKDEEMQKLNIYVPEAFFRGEAVYGYTAGTAPVFLPNTVGGYMAGPRERPGRDERGRVNAAFYALLHGYVVVSPGVRGRNSVSPEGRFVGVAPADICDLKAVVRFLRKFADRIPGDMEKIISNGTSAGGAMSALLGATGDHPDYEPYLKEMGAAEEADHIFAASCYCPITNLDHADMAYEWEYLGLIDYHRNVYGPDPEAVEKPEEAREERTADGRRIFVMDMTEEQQKLSEELAPLFPAYLNSLQLTDAQGAPLTLEAGGTGSFLDFVLSFVAASAQRELQRGTDLSQLDWLKVEDGHVSSIDFRKYAAYCTRMKPAPAFDSPAMDTPENEVFGTEEIRARHFTEFSRRHSLAGGKMADEQVIRLMNPMNYIRDPQAKKAEHFRIRHGSVDRDTTRAISAMLYAMLRQQGIDADLFYPWGIPHAGDYDLEELFAWIDQICRS